MSETAVERFARVRGESLDAFNRGDFEKAFADLAPDVEWHLLPWLLETGTLRGRDAVISYFSGILDGVNWHVESLEFIDAGGGRIVIHQRGRAAGKSTRIATEQGIIDFFQVWELRDDGRVASVREFDAREEALEAAGLSE
jgi:ketosteroid isomerase-like protein